MVQAGRALAAASVASFHLSILMGLPRYGGVAALQDFTQFGNRGVDFFFVISGFIILFAHFGELGQTSAIPGYAIKRIVRVYPIYWLYTAILTVLFLALGGTDIHLPQTVPDWLTTLTLIRFSSFSPPLPQAWTLFYEIGFYVVFCVFFLSKRTGIALFTAFLLVCVALYHFPKIDDQTALNVYTSAYNLYFAMGMVSYLIYRRPGLGLAETLIGAFLLVAAFTLVPVEMRGFHPMLLGSSFALLIAGLAKLERAGKLAPPAFLLAIGDSSYTLYLIHTNVEGVFLKLLNKIPETVMPGPTVRFAIALTMTIITGYAIYFLVERNLLKLIRRKLISPASRRPATAY
jgi:peptidoglycan/LPS O-acetylase OafA/YrhL